MGRQRTGHMTQRNASTHSDRRKIVKRRREAWGVGVGDATGGLAPRWKRVSSRAGKKTHRKAVQGAKSEGETWDKKAGKGKSMRVRETNLCKQQSLHNKGSMVNMTDRHGLMNSRRGRGDSQRNPAGDRKERRSEIGTERKREGSRVRTRLNNAWGFPETI